ncbi:uncharacterized protein LOC143625722 [Bidens hawaiensis]|uniref:uncharacterized protein LOC143625722 n=1 Tax=Bidens hawaiensis TaxID=980011 RepID=UPI00404A07B2
MDEAHKSRYFVHPGADKMYAGLRSVFWWPGMKKDITLYVAKCLTCSNVKDEQPPIPVWKWEDIAKDFITKIPSTRKQHDSIWVVIDRLTKSTHFIPIKEMYSVDRLAHIYVERIVCHHGTPLTIISDRDGRFTSCFWKSLLSSLGTHLDLSTAYHPQSDGQSERTIQTLEDMLHSCVLYLGFKRRLIVLLKSGIPVAYRLDIPSKLSNVHPVFHVSNLKKFLAEGNFQIPFDEVHIDETMHFVERPVEIMDHKDKVTKRSRIPLVKVLFEAAINYNDPELWTSITDGNYVPSTAPNNNATIELKMKKRDDKALSMLKLGLFWEILKTVNHHRTAKEMYEAVVDMFEGNIELKNIKKDRLKQQLDRFKFKDGERLKSVL